MKVLVAQLCPTLCNPMDCSLPDSSVDRILQGRILDWVAIPFSRESSGQGLEPGSPTLQAYSLPSEPPGKSLLGRVGDKHSVRGTFSLFLQKGPFALVSFCSGQKTNVSQRMHSDVFRTLERCLSQCSEVWAAPSRAATPIPY